MGYELVNLLGGLLIVTSTAVVVTRSIRIAIRWYAVQSLVLVGLLAALGVTTGAHELLTWAASAFGTKVVLVPLILSCTYKKMGRPADATIERVKPAWTIVLIAVEVAVCFAVVSQIKLPTAEIAVPALAISFAHFFVGLSCIITQQNIMKQMFGYCLMENGSHVTLALLAPTAPEIVEVGIATDAIFAVIIMSIVVYKIWNETQSLDASDLTDLKG
ncbi:MAG: hydrogenase 4 membrane subunit [Coriobacteriaceae bacterium]|nr:hydrogenase 4 membrane subunit [Coriobacteriaceae bacterium]